MGNALQRGRLEAWYGYLPNRAKWVRGSFSIGLVGAVTWLSVLS